MRLLGLESSAIQERIYSLSSAFCEMNRVTKRQKRNSK